MTATATWSCCGATATADHHCTPTPPAPVAEPAPIPTPAAATPARPEWTPPTPARPARRHRPRAAIAGGTATGIPAQIGA